MMRFIVYFFALIVFTGCTSLSTVPRFTPEKIAAMTPADFVSTVASEAGERGIFDEALLTIKDPEEFAGTEHGENMLAGAMWNVMFINREHATGLRIMSKALAAPNFLMRPADVQRALLSAAYTLYPLESVPLVAPLLGQLTAPRQFAIAAYALLRAEARGANVNARELVRAALLARADAPTEPRLIALARALDPATGTLLRPPLGDLLSAPIRAGFPVVYSLQRKDRRYMGRAVVRGADGKFVRNADGSVFNIPHLAHALTDLPGTITNGNTPQGLFTIVGMGLANSMLIGPTPYLYSKVPIEAKPAEFEHSEVSGEWDEARYESFLPASWKSYPPFKEAWLAGRAGRDEMLLHGTTINTDYYKNETFYPGTPSAGCLVAAETWSKADGKMIASDQLSLLKAFTRDGKDRGYLVVVEIDDKKSPVSFDEIVADLRAAER